MLLMAAAGCVSIYDSKVQVQAPNGVEQWGRSPLDQCTPHVYPHRLIQASAGVGSLLLQAGAQQINTQADFDQWWGTISPALDQDHVVTTGFKPVIDWNQQSVFFLPQNNPNSCIRWRPFGDEMTTDCYNTTITIYQWEEGQDCQNNATTYPVYVYIYPKSNWPVNFKFIYPTPTPTFTATSTATSTPTSTPTPADEEDE